MKFLDLTGYMFSGKAAFSDLLKEFAGFHIPHYRSEFDLIRIPHGLGDLKKAYENWSWVGSDSAIREFEKLTRILSRSPRGYQKLFQTGFHYEKNFPGFTVKTEKFIEDLTDNSWKMKWPFETASLTPLNIFILKVLSRFKRQPPWPEITYHLSSGDNFDELAKEYVQSLLVSGIDQKKNHTVVTHNALEPYNPQAGFCFFDDVKSIVVDRDVRDIYMTGSTYSKGFNDIVPLYSRIIGAFDIDVFIRRQKILRAKTNYKKNDKILRLNFEDLVLDYDKTALKVLKFLDIKTADHKNKFAYFRPEDSAKNTGLWKNANPEQRKNILKIEKEIPELCQYRR
jgi:hypothetical protein